MPSSHRAAFRGAKTVALAVLLLALGACSSGGGDNAAAAPVAADAPVPTPSDQRFPDGILAGETGLNDADSVALVRRHLAASDDGDADAWASALSDDVRFDIGGSVYEGLDEVRGWGERDPIGQGRYEIVSIDPVPGGVTADVVFRAGSLVEEIRYQYTVRDGRIVNLYARYR